jgi:chitinase
MKMKRFLARRVGWSVIAAITLASLPLGGATQTAGAVSPSAPQDHVIVAYFASWDIYGRNYHPSDIPVGGITHLNYAFATPTADGTCAPADPWADYERPYPANESVDGVADDPSNPNQHLFGNFNQLLKLKAAHPNLRILISIGGWSLSTYFSDVAATPASRSKFVQSCIDTFIKGNLPAGSPTQVGGQGSAAGLFDGIDLDWEFPGLDPGNGAHFSAADRHNATLLLQEFRSQLDQVGQQDGQHYLLTAALPGGDLHSSGSFELPLVADTVDWINLLTYDFHGPADPVTNFNAPFGINPSDPDPEGHLPFWNVSGTVAYYLAKGVPADKLVVGVPFYGKQYIRVASDNHGLYQSFNNSGMDSNSLQWDVTPTPTYHDLVDSAQIVSPSSGTGNNAKGLNGFKRYWNGDAGEPWLYDPAAPRLGSSTGVFISYDDPHSVAERTQLIRSDHLRGAMVWEISQDSDSHALLSALSPLLQQ